MHYYSGTTIALRERTPLTRWMIIGGQMKLGFVLFSMATAVSIVYSAEAQEIAGPYVSSLDSKPYSLRQRGDNGLDLYGEGDKVIGVLDRKSPNEQFKGKTNVLATTCPNSS